jgi:HK97 family phage major capsid protein
MYEPEIKALIESRATAWESAKALNDTVLEAKRDFTGEEQESYARHMADMDAKDVRIKELQDLSARNESYSEQRAKYDGVVNDPTAGRPDPEAAFVSFFRGEGPSAMEVSMAGLRVRTDRKSGTWELRDLTVGSAAGGGATVPAGFRAQLYEHLIQNTAIRQTNVTVLQTDSGENLTMPKTISFGTAAVVGEGTALAEADPAFGTTILGAWKYGQLIQVTNELLTDTAVDLLSFVARDAGRALAFATGTAYSTGAGTTSPLGVFVAAGTGVTGGTGVVGVPTGDNLIDLFYSVNPAYRANSFWFMADGTIATVRKIKDTTNQYLWQPGLQDGEPDRLLGKPVVNAAFAPAIGTGLKSIAFGDFSAYYIRDVASIRFERSDEFAFDKDLVTFRSIMRTDGRLHDLTGAIKLFRGGTA